jgi:hypothetical protein
MNRGKFIAKKEEVAWTKKSITVYSKYKKKRKSIALLINKRNLMLTVVA